MTFALCILQFAMIVVLVFAGLSLAQDATKGSAAPKPKISYDSVAEQMGLKPALLHEAMAELRRKNMGEKQALFYLIVAQERTRRFLAEGRIAPEESDRAFKEALEGFVAKYHNTRHWKTVLSEEQGLVVPEVTRRVQAIIREARGTEGRAKRGLGSRRSDYPEEMAPYLAERFEISQELLRAQWKELGKFDLKEALMFLILAQERTKRHIQGGAVKEEGREKAFVQALKFFQGQFQRGVGWGDLGIQVGRHSNDLNSEADTILKPFAAKPKVAKGAGQK